MDTFIKREGKILGPFSAEHFQNMLEAGKVFRSDELANEKREETYVWVPAAEFPGVLPGDLAGE